MTLSPRNSLNQRGSYSQNIGGGQKKFFDPSRLKLLGGQTTSLPPLDYSRPD